MTDAPPTRVLVVEDEAEARTVYALTLDMAGFEVRAACDGRQGLETALANPPDVVVTDLHMPRLDGDQMVAGLRASLGGDAPPVIVATSDEQARERLRKQRGVHRVLAKPLDPGDLVAAVRGAVAAR